MDNNHPLADDQSGSEDQRSHAALGAIYLARRNRTAALAHLGHAVALDPQDHLSRFRLGKAHLLAANPGAAVAVFEDLMARSPTYPGLAAALAGSYRRDARYADAIAIAQSSAEGEDQLLYERAMSETCLGDAAAGLASFDALLARQPHFAAAWYGSHGPALQLHGVSEAERRLDHAMACPGANRKYAAMRAAYALLLGREPMAAAPRHAYLTEAAAALRPALAPDWRLFGTTAALLRWTLEQARNSGLVLEFGVRRGTSITVLAATAGQDVHGFDSFEGLPEAWGSVAQGVLTTGCHLPPVPANVTLHAGWFEDTLPAFLDAEDKAVRFVNIDSDLYSSARLVLTALAGRIRPGTILVFDEFVGNRSWRDDEYRAFHEYAATAAISWHIIAISLATKQVAIKIG